MSRVIDTGLVALALIASVLYALAALGPRALRRRLRMTLARVAAGAHLPGAARRLERETGAGGCGAGCGSCESEPGASADNSEVRVPIDKIQRKSKP